MSRPVHVDVFWVPLALVGPRTMMRTLSPFERAGVAPTGSSADLSSHHVIGEAPDNLRYLCDPEHPMPRPAHGYWVHDVEELAGRLGRCKVCERVFLMDERESADAVLSVMLDFADDTGVYSLGLRRRVASRLADMQIAVLGSHDSSDLGGYLDATLAFEQNNVPRPVQRERVWLARAVDPALDSVVLGGVAEGDGLTVAWVSDMEERPVERGGRGIKAACAGRAATYGDAMARSLG